MIKNRIFISLFVLLNGFSFAQTKDFGIWSQVTLEKKFTPRLSLGLTECIRLNENATQLSTHYSQLALDYVLLKKLSVSFGYRNAQKFTFDEKINYRQRFQLDFIYKIKLQKLKIEFQERFQMQFQNIGRSETGLIPEYYFRTKVTLTYDLEKRITPYCSAEIFLNQYKYIDNLRFRVGFDYEFNKKNSAKIYYMLDQDVQQNDPLGFYALGFAYKYSF